MVPKYTFIVLTLFLIVSCEKKEEEQNLNNKYSKEKSSISFVEGITLHTDTFFNYNGISNYYFDLKNGNERIVVKNHNQVYEFDIPSGNIVNKLEFPVQGPNSVKGIHKLDGVVKLDDKEYIFIYHMLAEIYKINEQGAQVQFQLDPQDREIKGFYSSGAAFPIVNAENKLEIILPLMNHSRLEEHTKAFAFGKYDTQTGQFEEIINYPKIYDEHDWADQPYAYVSNIQFIPSREQYFVSFPIEPNIYIYDKKFNLVDKSRVQSEFIAKIPPFKEKKLTIQDQIDYMESRKYFRAMSFYMGAYYNPSTQLYYRLVRRAIENESGDHDYQYSFIICNLDLEIIDEVTVDSDQYNIFRTFVCSKGLMLLNESKMVDESEIPYDRMKVEYPL